jgi:uncharacterized protein
MISLAGLLRALLAIVPAFYLAMVGLMYAKQDELTFDPDPLRISPASVNVANADVVEIRTADGERLAAWYTPAKAGMPVILFLHGKGGNIGHRPRRYRFFTAQGFGVLFVDYRGYGGSTGTPSEQGLLADAEAAYTWLMAKGIAPQRLAVIGESLGTGIAVKLAARRPIAALALEAPYSSLSDIAADRYWWLPARLLINNPIDAAADIGKINSPLLVQHGDADQTVPIAYGRKLFDRANMPKVFVTIPGADHSIFNERTFALEAQFFEDVFGKPQ